MSEASCSGFEPQTYLRDRCKKCFRLRSKHEDPQSVPAAPSSPTTSLGTNPVRERNREKRRSWREKMTNGRDNGGPEHIHDGNEEDTTSCTSFKSATSRGMSSAKSVESIGSNQDTRSMVTAISESIADDERAATPIEPEQFQDTSLMKSEIERLKEEVSKLKEERQNWTIRRSKNVPEADQSLVEMLEERLAEAESCIQDYRDENTVLKCELRELQECGTMVPDGAESTKLYEKLKSNETLCEELMEENEALKADIKDLQQEIEEMQDQYREEEIEEFRELQRELEQNAKNCRILQFKLRKSERQREQLESEQKHLEAKVKDLLQASSSKGIDLVVGGSKQSDSIRIKELESELRIAKEVSVRLHNELEAAEEKRYKLEDDVFYMKEKVRELQTQTKWREARNKAEQQAVCLFF